MQCTVCCDTCIAIVSSLTLTLPFDVREMKMASTHNTYVLPLFKIAHLSHRYTSIICAHVSLFSAFDSFPILLGTFFILIKFIGRSHGDAIWFMICCQNCHSLKMKMCMVAWSIWRRDEINNWFHSSFISDWMPLFEMGCRLANSEEMQTFCVGETIFACISSIAFWVHLTHAKTTIRKKLSTEPRLHTVIDAIDSYQFHQRQIYYIKIMKTYSANQMQWDLVFRILFNRFFSTRVQLSWEIHFCREFWHLSWRDEDRVVIAHWTGQCTDVTTIINCQISTK